MLRAGLEKYIQRLFLFGTFNCNFIQHRVQVFIVSPSLSLFYRSRGSHSFSVSSPILEAFGKEGLGNTCGGEGKGGDETKVRRERRRRVCVGEGRRGMGGREDGRERQKEEEAQRNSMANFFVSGGSGRNFHQLSNFLNVKGLWRRLLANYYRTI